MSNDLTLYAVICRYRDAEKLAPHYEGHVRWVEKYAASGNLLLAGAAASRTDGVLIARAPDRARLEEILREDAFYEAGLVDLEITAFTPRRGRLRDNAENPLFFDEAAREAAFSEASGLPQGGDPKTQ